MDITFVRMASNTPAHIDFAAERPKVEEAVRRAGAPGLRPEQRRRFAPSSHLQ